MVVATVAASPADAALQLDDVTVRFGSKTVLANLDLTLAPGEKLVLAGASGCGKTTVLRCLLGFVRPESGRVLIDGQPLTAENVWQARGRIGYVPQEPDPPPGTVRDVIAAPFAYQANRHLRDRLDRRDELLDRFELGRDLLDKDIATLSGGEKQRVAIVSAILLDRRILLLDEPSSALDEARQRTVVDFFRRQDALTVLAVTHDPARFDLRGRTLTLPARGVS